MRELYDIQQMDLVSALHTKFLSCRLCKRTNVVTSTKKINHMKFFTNDTLLLLTEYALY